MNQRLDKLKVNPLNIYLGVQDIRCAENSAELDAIVNEQTVNISGLYHGGVIYTLSDVCAYSSLISQFDEKTEAVTHDLHVSLLQSAHHNDRVVYRATVKKLGRRLAFIDVESFVNNEIIATARVTKSIVSKQANPAARI